MKKIYLLLVIIALILQGCSSEMDDYSFEKENEGVSGIAAKQAGDGKYDLLGFSYDVTGDYLHVNSAKLKVVDIDAYIADPQNKDRFYNPATIIGSNEFYAGYDATDYLEEIKKKITSGGSGGLKILGISLSGSLKSTTEVHEKYTYSSKYSFARADVIKRIKRLYLNVMGPEDLMPYLSPAFVDDLNRMTPTQLVNSYGTHVLLDITIGGRLQFNYRSVINETTSYTEKKKITEAGAKFNIAIFGAGGNKYNESTEIRNLNTKNASWKLWLTYHGGTSSGMSYSFETTQGLTQANFDQSKWEESVNDRNAALVDINWDKAYPIYEFITDATKKQQVKSAVENYIASKKIEIINTLPMYALYNQREINCFYTSMFSEYNNYPSYSYVEKHGVVFHILERQESNAIPLYRVYDPRGKNHIYLSSGKYSEIADYQSWGCIYQRIEGYVYKTQQPGTIPIYGFYDSNSQNCILINDPADIPHYSTWCHFNGVAFYAYLAK